MRATKFIMDTFGDVIFEGFTQGETWNGWARPYFTFEQAQQIVAAYNSQGGQASYDNAEDVFSFKFGEDEIDIFPAESIKGQKLYPIGAGCWIWEEAYKEAL